MAGETKHEKQHDHSADAKTKDSVSKNGHKSKDSKKKGIIVGGSIFITLLGIAIYIHEKNNSNTNSTSTTASGLTSGSASNNGWSGGSDGGSYGGGGGSGGGTGSDPNSTIPSTPTPTNPDVTNPGSTAPSVPYDSAVEAALTKAKQALAKATKGGNKTAIANAKANLNKVQAIQNSRTGASAGGTVKAKAIASPASKGGKTEITKPAVKPAVHSSGGTTKISGTTATAKTIKAPVKARR